MISIDIQKHIQSQQLFERSKAVIPGGVNSPVRAFKSVGGTPVFMASASGALLHDVDGNSYIDYIGSWGPMLLGHAYPPVVAAVQEAATRSTSFGAPTALELELAKLVVQAVPGVEKVRMVNSGTEACMSALRLARGFTGRNKLIKFVGCYHGHADAFLIKAGSGAATLGLPDSPGVTIGTAQDTLLAEYNDLNAVDELISAYPGEIAALIVEPVGGNMGCIPPKAGFLEGLRARCTANGIVLIFDEVMTGFRLALGGAQELYGVTADLITLGKIIGAGLPVGAYAGRSELMDLVAPQGPVYQAGTLSGNPLAMSAGIALLSELSNHRSHYAALEEKAAYLAKGLAETCSQAGVAYRLNRVGSMLSLHFTEHDAVDFQSVQRQDVARFGRFFHSMLEQGIYLPPSAYESWFLSDAHSYAQLDETIAAAKVALSLP